jgi:hypothetical protein
MVRQDVSFSPHKSDRVVLYPPSTVAIPSFTKYGSDMEEHDKKELLIKSLEMASSVV